MAALSLSLINYFEFFVAPKSGCFSLNQLSLYGSDNFLWCPNTRIVHQTELAEFQRISIYECSGSRPVITNSSVIANSFNHMGFYGDQYYEWYFLLNQGSTLNLTFTGATELLSFTLDNQVHYMQQPNQNFSFTFDTDDSHNLQVRTSAWNLTENYASLTITVNLTYYSTDGCTVVSSGLAFNITDSFTYGQETCLNMFANYQRNWAPGYLGSCSFVTNSGFDEYYEMFILPVTLVVLLVVILTNVLVCVFAPTKSAAPVKSALLTTDSSL